LPTDGEWSAAVGLTAEKGATPGEKDNNGPRDLYPWGHRWPPPPGAGNFADESAKKADLGFGYIDGYDDGYPWTSPVDAFAANALGIYDLGGNVENWCADWYDGRATAHVLRGGSWRYYLKFYLRSASRSFAPPDYRAPNYGFRCVIARPAH
jgi:formylglycine-generating enzyme required for sulfatase activity